MLIKKRNHDRWRQTCRSNEMGWQPRLPFQRVGVRLEGHSGRQDSLLVPREGTFDGEVSKRECAKKVLWTKCPKLCRGRDGQVHVQPIP